MGQRTISFTGPLKALRATACKTSGHSQAWPNMAANENVFMGGPKTKKPRIIRSGAVAAGEFVLMTPRPAKRHAATLIRYQECKW
jgi:hypothetical protein